jgi:hypothetical protein
VGGLRHAALCSEVDRWLQARVGSADRIPVIRDNLLLELGRLACAGDALVSATDFFSKRGLAATPLTEWAELSRKAHIHLADTLRRKRAESLSKMG